MKDNTKNNLLIIAIYNEDLQSIKALVENGFDVNMPNRTYQAMTPLIAALQKGNDTIIQYLLNHGATINPHAEVSAYAAHTHPYQNPTSNNAETSSSTGVSSTSAASEENNNNQHSEPTPSPTKKKKNYSRFLKRNCSRPHKNVQRNCR